MADQQHSHDEGELERTIDETLQEELANLGMGEVKLSEEGLSLPISMHAEANAPESSEITPEDLASLALVEAELDQRWSETKIDPTLERVELLMDLLGNPERAFNAIHVAGTNGKRRQCA